MTTTMASMQRDDDIEPWYKQGWPWFLMAIPGVAVVLGFGMLWAAIVTWDGLVVDDYYKEGQAIAQTMGRSAEAGRLGLEAQVSLKAEDITVRLASSQGEALPPSIIVTIAHPTRTGLDQVRALVGSDGVYSGELAPLGVSRWQIQIEDEARTWRLNGTANLPTETELRILPYSSS